MTDAIRRDPLNPQAEALTDAQTELKLLVKHAVLRRMPPAELRERVQKIIKRALAKVRSPTLKRDAAISLARFAVQIYRNLYNRLKDPALASAVLLLLGGKGSRREQGEAERIAAQRANERLVRYETDTKGVPLQKYMRDYIRRDVMPAFRALAEERALDPGKDRGTLRNLAEMQVRYEAQQREIAELREAGERLVVCSVHADCSERCASYQGRVYSLDGTRGKTEDGRPFVPLEEATQNPRDRYTTKAGKTYQNGLLGFNCRHKLFPYRSGMQIPSVTRAEQEREYKITQIQREMERRVLEARENALVASKDIDPEAYRYWMREAKRRNEEYIRFSREHDRAYYPDRTKLL